MTHDFANKVRSQLELWNSVVMHDGTGQFINFYEVTSLNSIGGKPVIKVVQHVFSNNTAGSFNHEDENAPIVKLDPNMNADTPLHEFGHVLGLADLDESSSDVRQHSVLMGYNRNTMETTINEAIK
jgi:predicted Zn-dependent protease